MSELIWAQTMRDLDINPWTVVTDAVQLIPQIEAWRRDRVAKNALADFVVATGIAIATGTLGMVIGIEMPYDWDSTEVPRRRAETARRAAHPLSLAGDFGPTSELEYFGGPPLTGEECTCQLAGPFSGETHWHLGALKDAK